MCNCWYIDVSEGENITFIRIVCAEKMLITFFSTADMVSGAYQIGTAWRLSSVRQQLA